MVMEMFDAMLGVTRVIIKENQRAIALFKGQFQGILTPGEHRLQNARKRLEIEMHDLARPEFVSAYEKALFREHRAVAERHLTEFRAGTDEVLVVSGLFDRNGNFLQSVSKTVKMRLKDETLAGKLDSGIALRSDFKVAPGRYVLRLVVRDAEGQMMAAQNGAVEIP